MMDNVLLGKTLKAMYKLSGKTLMQLSDETGLTVDTINNLFYARVQKPGFIGVSTFVKATGHAISELSGFLEVAETLPEEADIIDEFTKYLFSVKDTVPFAVTTSAYNSFVNATNNVSVNTTGAGGFSAGNELPVTGKNCADHSTGCALSKDGTATHECCLQIQTLNEEHEKQLDRFRATHLHYVDEINNKHREQISQMEEEIRKLTEHYDHSVGEIKKSHEREIQRQESEVKFLKRTNILLTLALVAIATAAVILAVLIKG